MYAYNGQYMHTFSLELLRLFQLWPLGVLSQSDSTSCSRPVVKSIISPESSDFFDRRSTVKMQILVVFTLMGYVWLALGPLSFYNQTKKVSRKREKKKKEKKKYKLILVKKVNGTQDSTERTPSGQSWNNLSNSINKVVYYFRPK